MKNSKQDRIYLEREADAFFERCNERADPTTLRPNKRSIAAALEEAQVSPKRVLEFGCGYGDLLNEYAERGASACIGIEPSEKAVAFGRAAYSSQISQTAHTAAPSGVELWQGTIAANPISDDERSRGSFDLVIVEDVLCWVSRETLFQSIANIDDALMDGGHLFIREFLPLSNTRNANHHLEGEEVYCYKPAGPHSRMFTASGVYEVVWQKSWIDRQDGWVESGGRDAFESRWSDVVLRKSYADYFR